MSPLELTVAIGFGLLLRDVVRLSIMGIFASLGERAPQWLKNIFYIW